MCNLWPARCALAVIWTVVTRCSSSGCRGSGCHGSGGGGRRQSFGRSVLLSPRLERAAKQTVNKHHVRAQRETTTSGQRNPTRGRIAVAHGPLSRICQLATMCTRCLIHGFWGPHGTFLGINGTSFLKVRCPSCCPINKPKKRKHQLHNYKKIYNYNYTHLIYNYKWNIIVKIQHTHIHPALCPGLPGWAGTRKVGTIWILLKQETVSGSGISWAICKSASRSRQTTTPAPHHSVFLQAGCRSCRPTNSVKALKAH